MDIKKKYWDKKLAEYALQDWINKPSIFAEWAIQFFPKTGKILELGAGLGQDTKFFASKGYSVVATDFSEKGLNVIRKIVPSNGPTISTQKLDLKEAFPFPDDSFDIIYAHMSIHFFDQTTTERIFSDIYRVLKPHGVVAIQVNSKDDHEYGLGSRLEDDFFRTRIDIDKRFFDIKSMGKFAQQFGTLALDNEGRTYKDDKKGVSGLIRFVGRKPQKID